MQDAPYCLLPLYCHREVVAHAKVDAADFAELSRSTWHLWAGFYPAREAQGQTIYLHRHLAGLRTGDRRSVDHINGDRLDNRRANLRICQRGQLDNLQNRAKLNSNNRSGYRGVTWETQTKRWRAGVKVAGVRYNLGRFDDPAEAGAVAAAFRRQHMPFARD